jgi:preprotein translocase subunit SecE
MLKKKKEEKVIKEEVIDKKTKSKKTKKDNSGKSSFGKEFRAEIKKIIWPKKKELFTNSVVVIGSVLIVSVIIFLLDLGFNELTNLEIKAISGNKENTAVENVVDENNETVDANSVETTGDAETSATQTPEEGTENAETEENSQSFEVQE